MQGILALTVNKLGMSLTTMQSHDSVKVLEELDFTVSLDSRQSSARQMTSIELSMQPIVLRASLLDISLITAIVVRAANLYSVHRQRQDVVLNKRSSHAASALSDPRSRSSASRSSIQKPKVYISKEKACGVSHVGRDFADINTQCS